jgi:DNA polymerase-3 subunit delta
MAEMNYRQLESHLEGIDRSDPAADAGPVFLIFGDDMLVEKAFTGLLDRLLPADQRSFGYEPLDGTIATAADVVECVTTYGLSPDLKLVAWRGARLFRPAADRKQLLSAARQAVEARENRKAASFFLKFLATTGLSFEDLGRAERASGQVPGLGGGRDDDWVDDLISYCQAKQLQPAVPEDQAELIKRALERGLPRRHILVITTEGVDRRQALYKLIRDVGVVVDCSVPGGNRRADRQAQEKVLSDTMHAVLKPHRKTMDRRAFRALCEHTGFDLRTFANNLEMLVQFAGSRSGISAEDVANTLQRTKQDPIYELTNAVSDRSLETALFFLASLLAADAHPLQIVAALTNQFRRLLLARDFADSDRGQAWFEDCDYQQFRERVIPAMVAYDQQLLEEVGRWQRQLMPGVSPARDGAGRAKKTKVKKPGDLLLAQNPKNPYPLYLLMRKAARFTRDDLLLALADLLDSDRHLKSSAQDPKMALERLVMRLCGSRQKPVGAIRPRKD